MKKLFPILLATALTASVLAGCTPKPATPVAAPAADPAVSAPANEAPAPASAEPVTITIVNKDMSPDDPIISAFFTRLHEAMKAKGMDVTVKVEPVQSGTYSEKLGLLLQSGTIPDIIYFQGGDYQFAVTQKILLDMTEMVNNSPDVQASMNEFNKARFANYPYLLWLNPTITPTAVVRKDFFDKTTSGKTLLEDPTTDNYYNFMKELKEVNGLKSAYTVGGNISEMDTIFDQAFGNTTTWLKNSDGTYTYYRVSEAEKNKLAFYAKLYKEGLLDNEYLTKKWDTKEKAFYDGEAGIIAGTQGKVIDIYNSKSVGQNGASAEVMVLPPAKGVAQGYTPVDVSKEGRGYAISALSKHPKEAFSVFEFLATPEGQIMDRLGEEGVHYQIVDNKIKLLPAFSEWFERFWGTTVNFKPETPFDPSTPFLSKAAVDSLANVDKFGTKDNMFIVTSELAPKLDAAKAVYTEFAADVITGKKDISEFDNYVKAFMENGGKDITDYANEHLK